MSINKMHRKCILDRSPFIENMGCCTLIWLIIIDTTSKLKGFCFSDQGEEQIRNHRGKMFKREGT